MPQDDKTRSDNSMQTRGDAGTLEAGIRERAYEIWVLEGRPEGRQAAHWDQARSELEGRPDTASSPSAEGPASGTSRHVDAAAPKKSKASATPRAKTTRP